jgi:hypothetical protein
MVPLTIINVIDDIGTTAQLRQSPQVSIMGGINARGGVLSCAPTR